MLIQSKFFKFYNHLCKKLPDNKIRSKKILSFFYSNEHQRIFEVAFSVSASQFLSLVSGVVGTLFFLMVLINFLGIISSNIYFIIIIFIVIFGLFLIKWPVIIIGKEIRNKMNFIQLFLIEIEIFIDHSQKDDKFVRFIELLKTSPSIAWNQREILQNIYHGKNPKNQLQSLHFYTSFYNQIFKQHFIESDLVIQSKLSQEYSAYYRQKIEYFNSTFENRINIFFFVTIFYPLGLLYYMSISEDIVWISIKGLLIFVVLLVSVSKGLLQQKYELLGTAIENKHKAKQYEAFLTFLKHLSVISSRFSFEYAFLSSISKLSQQNKKLLGIKKKNPNFTISNFNNFMINFFRNIRDENLKIFVFSFMNLLKCNQMKTRLFYSKINSVIENHFNIGKERQLQIKSSKFRAKIYKIISCFILGVLTPLMYRFQAIFKYISFFNEKMEGLEEFTQLEIENPIFFLIYSLILLIVILFSLNRMISNQIFKKGDLIVIIFYILIFYFSNQIWINIWII